MHTHAHTSPSLYLSLPHSLLTLSLSSVAHTGGEERGQGSRFLRVLLRLRGRRRCCRRLLHPVFGGGSRSQGVERPARDHGAARPSPPCLFDLHRRPC